MDLRLPEFNGWDAAKLLKSDPQTQHIPLIALSAHAMSNDRTQALEATGVLALARVVGIHETHTRINDQPLVKLDPTGAGRRRWTTRWKAPLNAFQIAFEGRLTPATH